MLDIVALKFLKYKVRKASLCCSTLVATLSAVNGCGQTAPSLRMSIDYLVRFVQVHETFRKPELEALACLAKISLEFLFYRECVGPFSPLICRCGFSFPLSNCYFLIQDSLHFVSSDFMTKRRQRRSSVEVY